MMSARTCLGRIRHRLPFAAPHHASLLRRKATQANATAAVSDFFSSLRWKAASALTSSLPEAEKKELFEKLDLNELPPPLQEASAASDTEADVSTREKSIAEAVAMARADEARKQQDRWEKEREQLFTQAEEAAKARIEQELAIQQQRTKRFQEWMNEVKEATSEGTLIDAQIAEKQHPVLGPVISDFGYKRVHSVSAKTLSSIAVWKKQRTFRHDRAKTMAKDKLKSLHLGFPGVIVLHEVSNRSYLL